MRNFKQEEETLNARIQADFSDWQAHLLKAELYYDLLYNNDFDFEIFVGQDKLEDELEREDGSTIIDDAIEKVRELNPDSIELCLLQAKIGMFRGGMDSKEIKAFIDHALAKEPQNVDALLTLAKWYYYEENDYDKAFDLCSKVQQIGPMNPVAYYLRTDLSVYIDMDKYTGEMEERDYQRLIQFKPTHMGPYYNRAVFFSCIPQYEDALADVDRCIELDNGHYKESEPYILRASINRELGNYDEALNDIAKAIEAIVNDSNALRCQICIEKGEIYDAMGDSVNAMNAFKEAVKYDQEYYATHYDMDKREAQALGDTEALEKYNRRISLANGATPYDFYVAAIEKAEEKSLPAKEKEPAKNEGHYNKNEREDRPSFWSRLKSKFFG
ncbi:hypothetical protein [Dysgonomonas sp. 25]|uniref:tetratricopeptide repeat protein n=1 Tax=Dysgonomonas sp. 25 TaxID=2302933 RepID=UPI0013D14425|nr:hypothetical protein [Dysgonomonas sp. 25]NDV69298.1 hypothetical protein [Dysgonomonas sp. 25]